MAVRTRWLGRGYEMECRDDATGHRLLADEPAHIGGSDAGLNAFALLQMALATCAISTMLRVARDERIPVESIEVDVSYKLNRIDESATTHYSVTLGLRITELIERIFVSGNIDEDQLATLFRGAEFCPVSNTLAGGVPIRRKIALAAPSQRAGQGR